MTLSRNQFFLLAGIILVVPFIIPKMIWLAGSRRSMGEMRYWGHGDLGSALGITTYPVLRYILQGDTIYFDSNINMDLQRGQEIPIRYQVNDPADALVDSFAAIWMRPLSYALLPLLILLVLYLTPDRLDPLIPRKSKIVLGKRPFVRILPAGSNGITGRQ
ncbi:MAG TPA: DUF3592 domain-containing protein [Puia sp.]|nr:DUF3592 domain-containing protein [Puia sp.]